MTVKDQIKEHQEVTALLYPLVPAIETVANRFIEAVKQNKTIFWCGNGGSAADAQHLATELVVRFEKERRPIRSIALTTDTSIITAVSNDYGFDSLFKRQLAALGHSGDILMALSTSGKSANVNEAVYYANDKGIDTIALTGKDGGKLNTIADISLVIPSQVTARIQEMHILIGHILCQIVEEHL
jgi:D-sedoheptulose 7-phosphate isomerase